MVNFVPAFAYHFCLALPAAFTQPGNHLLAEPCTGDGGENKHDGREGGRDIIAQKNIAHSHSEQKKEEEKGRGAPLRSVSMLQFLLDSSGGHCQRKKEEKKAFREEEELGTTVEMGYQMMR